MRIICTIATVVFLCGFTGSAGAQPSEAPKVVALESGTDEADAAGLFRAVRAQLAGVEVVLERMRADMLTPGERATAASIAASTAGAAMVFWIEDGNPCQVFFYIPSPTGGRFFNRSLEIEPSSGPGRYETIGIAAAGMVEGLLISYRKEIEVAQSLPRNTTPPAGADEAETNGALSTQLSQNHTFELSAAYAGVVFARNLFGHGVRFGLGLFPIRHLMIGVSFQLTFLNTVTGELADLTVHARTLRAYLAGRWIARHTELRVGLSYTVDLRSYTARPRMEGVTVPPSKFRGVHSICPSFTVIRLLGVRLGLFLDLEGDIAVNETDYTIEIDGIESVSLSPWTAKFGIQAGFLIQI